MLGAGISGIFGGGSSQPAAAEAAPPPPVTQANTNAWGDSSNVSCDADAKSFTNCMSEHRGDMQICGWYLEQLVSSISLSISYCDLALIRCFRFSESMPEHGQELLNSSEVR